MVWWQSSDSSLRHLPLFMYCICAASPVCVMNSCCYLAYMQFRFQLLECGLAEIKMVRVLWEKRFWSADGMAAIHWCCHGGGGRKTSARQRSLSLPPVKLCSDSEGKRGSNYKWHLTLQYLLIQRNETVLTLKKLRLPSKYMVEGMGNVHPNMLEDLKEEINCKSCTAPLATFFFMQATWNVRAAENTWWSEQENFNNNVI